MNDNNPVAPPRRSATFRPGRRLRTAFMALLAAAMVMTMAPMTPASAQQDRVLFDFSQNSDRFWAYTQDNRGAELSSELRGGDLYLSASLRDRNSYAWSGKNVPVSDWRNYDALRFDFAGLGSGQRVLIVFYEGSDRERFEYSFIDNSTSRRTITANFDDFAPSSWQPARRPPERLDLNDISSMLFEFRGPGNGAMRLGTMRLVGETQQPDGRQPIRTERTTRPVIDDPNGGGLLQLVCSNNRNFLIERTDPIVLFGRENAGHEHMFLGNQEINPRSVNVGGGANDINFDERTTCPGGGANLSGYWVPSLRDGRGNLQQPDDVNIYYKRGSIDNRQLQNFPAGLKMIAGTAAQATPSNGQTVAYWRCTGTGDSNDDFVSVTIPECKSPGILKMFVVFPQCWNERDLYRADGRHVAYAEAFGGSRTDSNNVPYYRECPDSHPHVMPEITYQFHYRMRSGQDAQWWNLSSDGARDGGSTTHADWMNGWHPPTFQQVIDNCMKREDIQCQNQISRTVALAR